MFKKVLKKVLNELQFLSCNSLLNNVGPEGLEPSTP